MKTENEEKVRFWVYPVELVQLYENRKINAEEMMLIGKIWTFKKCQVSNKWLAAWWGKHPRWVSETIQKLIKLEILESKIEEGSRILSIVGFCRQPYEKTRTPYEKTRRPSKYIHSYSSNTHSRAGAPHTASGVCKKHANGFLPNSEAGASPVISKLVSTFSDFTVRNSLHLGKRGSTRNGWTRETLNKWEKSLRELLDQGLLADHVQLVMAWYFEHFRDDYMPQCYTLTTFCQRWTDLCRVFRKKSPYTFALEKDDKEDALPRIRKIYLK